MKPRLLDLFCGAGGAAMGYYRAGFEVIGVDIKPQPHYPFDFVQTDAIEFLEFLTRSGGRWKPGAWLKQYDEISFDAIHASPPCQAFSTLKVMANAGQYSDLLTPARELLMEKGLPFVIENVVGAPIELKQPSFFSPVMGVVLCGSMFSLANGQYELRRHRLFESSLPLIQPTCRHRLPVIGFYGDHARTQQRTVAGHRDRGGDITGTARKLKLVKELTDIDWMTWKEATQAIPPAYTEFIGKQLMASILTNAREGERR